jgi:hypothetical protein
MSGAPSEFTHSQRLRLKLKLAMPELGLAGHAIHSHPRLAEILPDYLYMTHCIIRASVPLMRVAATRSGELAASDPVAAAIAEYFPKHIREEMHHDDWLLEDLEVLGFEPAEMLKRPPSPSVAAMVGSQYYWIHHCHPVALLGYIAVMEGYPPTIEQVDDLVARTGFPRAAFRTMLRHAQLDPHHCEDLDRLLDSLPLTSQQVSMIGVSGLQTVHLGSAAVREVVSRFEDRFGTSASVPGHVALVESFKP